MAPEKTEVLWRWGSGEAAGADTLEAVVTNLHTGGSGHRVALYWTEAAVEFGSPLGV